MSWCGRYTSNWGPCRLDVIASVVFAFFAAFIISTSLRRIQLLRRRLRSNTTPLWGWKTLTLDTLYCLNAGVHVALVVVALGVPQAARFMILSEALLLCVWLAVTVTCLLEWKAKLTISLRLLAWPAVVLYSTRIYIHARVLVADRTTAPLGTALLAISAVQAANMVAASILETLKSPSKEEVDELKTALLRHDEEAPREAKKNRSWLSLLGSAVIYVWPDALPMQLRVAACILIVSCVRLLNLAVPILYRNAVNKLAEVSDLTHPRRGEVPQRFKFMEVFYPVILVYMLAACFQGGPATSMGLNNFRQFLFISVSQSAYRRISVELFDHILGLDLKFHLMRKTGEITRQLDRGTAAIQNVLSTVVFNIGPSLFDIVAASVYVAASLSTWVAVIVFVTMSSYIPVTIWLTEWRGGLRRAMNRTDNVKSARVTDALLNFETVRYFNNEGLEVRRYEDAVVEYQKVEWRLLASLSALNILQTVIIWLGLGCGLIVCVKGAADGSLTVGDTVLFLTIMQQLYGPLNYFGSYYRQIQQYMIDMENMFELFEKRPSIQDAPDAKALIADGAPSLEFDNVSFAFLQGSPVIQDVSFLVGAGATLALVGATGSGKSTIVRLIYRLYDPASGCIRLNGQELTSLTQSSMRDKMAMVPQDVVLFNDTIEFNIRYGRPSASREEVEAAAEAACIHDAITGRFPAQYDTIVGERGLRLSGGEKQRVGVARAILKSPGLLLLDEGTSALDSLTEQRIQDALAAVRSTKVIVAHRLSTIMDATSILVMKEGCVVEMGSHPQLMQMRGLYAEMWNRQAEARTQAGGTANASAQSLVSHSGSEQAEEALGIDLHGRRHH